MNPAAGVLLSVAIATRRNSAAVPRCNPSSPASRFCRQLPDSSMRMVYQTRQGRTRILEVAGAKIEFLGTAAILPRLAAASDRRAATSAAGSTRRSAAGPRSATVASCDKRFEMAQSDRAPRRVARSRRRPAIALHAIAALILHCRTRHPPPRRCRFGSSRRRGPGDFSR